MFLEITKKCWNEEIKSQMKNCLKNKSMVQMKDTIEKLINILGRRCFQNAAHIDYFDDV